MTNYYEEMEVVWDLLLVWPDRKWGTVNVKAGEKKLVRIEKSDDYR